MQNRRCVLLYRAAVALVLLCSVSLYVWKFDYFQVGTYMDDAEYIALARSIAQGDDYGVSTGYGTVLPSRYPFGWPFMLAAVYVVSDGSLQSLKTLSLLVTVANTLLILRAWKVLGLPSRFVALAVASLYALSPLVVGHAGMLMSEPAFLLWALLLLILTAESGRDSWDRLLIWVGLGIAWVFAVYVRTIGLGLLVASLLYLVSKRRWMGLVTVASVSIATLALIVVLTAIDWHDLAGFGEYADQFRDPARWGQVGVATNVLHRAGQGVFEYGSIHLRDALIPFIGGPTSYRILRGIGLGFVPSLISLFVLGLVMLGFVLNAKVYGLLPTHVFVALYAAVALVWPWRGTRFLYGILPFLFAYLLIGGSALIQSLSQLAARSGPLRGILAKVGPAGVILLLCAHVLASAKIEHSLNHVRDFSVGTTWLRENTEPDAVIAAEQPAAIFLYAQRSTVDLPKEVGELQALRSHFNHLYVLIAPQLVWSEGRELRYSRNAQEMLDSLESGVVPATVVFQNEREMVRVYRLSAPEGERRLK